jgi:hypothetical protein
MAKDDIVITRRSKQAHFDYDVMQVDIAPLGGYHLHCLTPSARWLLVSLVEFYGEFHNRFDNWPDERSIDQVRTEALEGLICPMACEEDFQSLVAAVQGIGLTLIEIRDRLGPEAGDLDGKIEGVSDSVDGLTVQLADLGLPDLIDKLEPMLNGVGVILGAPDVPLNGA